MKHKFKYLTLGLILSLGAGFASCGSDDDEVVDPYASIYDKDKDKEEETDPEKQKAAEEAAAKEAEKKRQQELERKRNARRIPPQRRMPTRCILSQWFAGARLWANCMWRDATSRTNRAISSISTA